MEGSKEARNDGRKELLAVVVTCCFEQQAGRKALGTT